MLTLQKTKALEIVSVPISERDVEELLSKEWLLTNSRGGYASSTIVGCNTRRYHGLLIGSLNPPANRVMALSNCLEMVIFNDRTGRNNSRGPRHNRVFNLSTFEFDGKLAPDGLACIKRFRRDTAVHFDYKIDKLKLTKSIYLLRDADTVGLVYNFKRVEEPFDFVCRPFVGLRNFHDLQKSYAPLCSRWLGDGLLVRHDIPGSCELFLSSPSMHFEKDEQWWFNFIYRNDRDRGQNFAEDLWTPGFFKCRVDSPVKIVFWANLSRQYEPGQLTPIDIEEVRKDLRRHQKAVIDAPHAAKTRDDKLKKLFLAADEFITKRCADHDHRTTILAGFPWFADWGRDAFIALPGLLLATGRFEEAKSVLTTFARAADDGLIPNRFDGYSDTACFNSIDASFWFINAAFQYLNATRDTKTFAEKLLPTIRRVIESYQQGTRFDIHADDDALITGGSEDTQLTWMDARYEGHSFTPRHGKAVEINALWYNALCLLAEFYAKGNPQTAKHYHSMADEVKNSFCALFWNEGKGYLNDCILPDGSADASLRPNQIFAVSLPFSPLQPDRQRAVVDTVQNNLLTPYGLRTLNVEDSRYKGTYTGPQGQRDEAYHQGTVWPYLIGPFVESYLKVNDFSRKSKKQAIELIEPLMEHLTQDACLGQISEIFDGDAPHKPRGCIAQAWSVAELIRAFLLTS